MKIDQPEDYNFGNFMDKNLIFFSQAVENINKNFAEEKSKQYEGVPIEVGDTVNLKSVEESSFKELENKSRKVAEKENLTSTLTTSKNFYKNKVLISLKGKKIN
jgi:hypothetical protein